MNTSRTGRQGNSFVPKLREAAMKEATMLSTCEQRKGKPTFEVDHKLARSNDVPAEDFDRDNGVSQYAGQNIEHIGNGSGGPRR